MPSWGTCCVGTFVPVRSSEPNLARCRFLTRTVRTSPTSGVLTRSGVPVRDCHIHGCCRVEGVNIPNRQECCDVDELSGADSGGSSDGRGLGRVRVRPRDVGGAAVERLRRPPNMVALAGNRQVPRRGGTARWTAGDPTRYCRGGRPGAVLHWGGHHRDPCTMVLPHSVSPGVRGTSDRLVDRRDRHLNRAGRDAVVQDRELLALRFEQERPRLRGAAYRMLGSAAEAEDAVQEAWLRLERTDPTSVENLQAWLTTVVARVCLNMLRARNSRGERPLDVPVTPAADTDVEQETLLSDSVGLALLVVLDTLAPRERLAFVLHDMFDLPFDEIAPIVDRSTAATRQVASRARRRIHGSQLPEGDR